MISAEAPSNIALIKYMGKLPAQTQDVNRPTNASLSYTLDHLRSRVEITKTQHQDSWSPLKKDSWLTLDLNYKGRDKFLNHFARLKNAFGIDGFYEVSSANNFPAGAGIASSASSFAALTLATYKLARSLKPDFDLSLAKLADFSRQGSGSSGRSLFSSYCLWDKEGFHQVGQKWPNLIHDLIVIDDQHKFIGSSDAHLLVANSSMFSGRVERAHLRLQELMQAFDSMNLEALTKICWDELWDMHTLFHTSNPAFMYMNENTLLALRIINQATRGVTGPIVTMDAGANIHLLYFPGQETLRKSITEKLQAFKLLQQKAVL